MASPSYDSAALRQHGHVMAVRRGGRLSRQRRHGNRKKQLKRYTVRLRITNAHVVGICCVERAETGAADLKPRVEQPPLSG